ncbi:MAG: glycosyltransferase family 39 protein [Chloroflexi bacterium]|nr:glycosyltransferase family 39 protein [Chloroflexota bacterium]MCY4246652.1 glycosyltransferase family 39 protein [Chloroflexota bacterium]
MTRLSLPLHHALMLCATIALLFAAIVYAVYAANLIAFPYDYDQGEGFEVQDTALLSQFKLPYLDTETYPFYSSNYPPLFHMLAAPFVWVFGPAYWYGRLLGFAASLLIAAVIAHAVYRDGQQNRWIALLAGLAFLSSNFVYHIGPLFRQHIAMVAFETLAVVMLARAFPRGDKRGITLALFFLLCAGYTKQLAAITALAAIIWMFLRGPRRGLICTAGFGLAGGLVFLWLTLASGGHWWTQAIVANVNDFLYDQAVGLFRLWFGLHGFLLVPATLLVMVELYADRLSIYSIWFVATAGLGGAAAGTWGAGDSYLVTSIAAACILSGVFFSKMLANAWTPSRILQVLPLARIASMSLLLVPALYLGYARATLKMPTIGEFAALAELLGIERNVAFHTRPDEPDFYDSATWTAGGYARIGYLLTEADHAAGAQIVARIQQSDKPALSEDAGFSIAAGRDVVTNPTQLRNLHLAGQFAGDELTRMIEDQAFGLIILRAQFFPPHILEAMGQAYVHNETLFMNGFDYLLLFPRPGYESRFAS